jgi:hypothetical protein
MLEGSTVVRTISARRMAHRVLVTPVRRPRPAPTSPAGGVRSAHRCCRVASGGRPICLALRALAGVAGGDWRCWAGLAGMWALARALCSTAAGWRSSGRARPLGAGPPRASRRRRNAGADRARLGPVTPRRLAPACSGAAIPALAAHGWVALPASWLPGRSSCCAVSAGCRRGPTRAVQRAAWTLVALFAGRLTATSLRSPYRPAAWRPERHNRLTGLRHMSVPAAPADRSLRAWKASFWASVLSARGGGRRVFGLRFMLMAGNRPLFSARRRGKRG